MCAEFDSIKLTPQEQADMALIASSKLLPACQQFGQVLRHPCPEKSYATGKGLETVTVGEPSTVTVHAVDRVGSKCASPLPDTNISWEVTITERGQIIIAEWGGHCISIYKPNGEKIKSFGQKGLSPGQFNTLRGVAVDRAGNIIVVDGDNHRIQQFTGDGKLMRLVGSEGSGPGQFNCPLGIGISPSGKVYICDRWNHRVQI